MKRNRCGGFIAALIAWLIFGLSARAETKPPTLHLAGSWPGLPRGALSDLEIVGNYALVAGRGLLVFDVTHPAKPTTVRVVDTGGTASRIQIAGRNLYLNCAGRGWGGVQVFDIGAPTNPVSVGFLANYAAGGAVAVTSRYVLWAGRKSRGLIAGSEPDDLEAPPALSVYELDDPMLTNRVGTYETEGAFQGLVVEGPYAYGAVTGGDENTDWAQLQILDLGQPTHPTQVGRLELGGQAVGVEMAGSVAWMATRRDVGTNALVRLHGIDVSEPAKPLLLSTYETEVPASESLALNLRVNGPWGYLSIYGDSSHTGRTEILDLSDRMAPRRVGALEGIAGRIECIDHFLYVTGKGGLQVFDFQDPWRPVRTWCLDLAGDVQMLQVVGDYTYVADAEGGLRVLDASNPVEPTQIGTYAGYVGDVQVVGHQAYVTGDGFAIIDLSDPLQPVLLGRIAIEGEASAVQVVGHFAIFAAAEKGMAIVDVSDPAKPRLAATSPITDNSYWAMRSAYVSLCMVDHVGYVATRALGMDLVDLRDPTHPVRVGNVQPSQGWRPVRIRKVGPYAYMTTITSPEDFPEIAPQYHFEIFDVSAPESPIRIGRLPIPAEPQAVEVQSPFAFVATKEGLELIDVGDPSKPTRVGRFGGVAGVHLQAVADRLYVAGGDLRIFTFEGASLSQSIAFAPLQDRLSGSPPFALEATSDSRLPITFQVVCGPATISGNTLTVTGLGDVTIRASQAGSALYRPASSERSFVVADRLYLPEVEAEHGRVLFGPKPPPYAAGQECVLTAVPDPGYWLMGWSGDAAGRQNLAAVVMDGPKRIRAHFGTLQQIGQFQAEGHAENVAIAGNFAFIPNDEADSGMWTGLRIIDVSNPVNPVQVGAYRTVGRAREVVVRGSYAYLLEAYPNYDLSILEISDPAHLRLVGTASVRSRVERGVSILGDYAYLAAVGDAKLCIWNVADPAHPFEVAECEVPHPADVHVEGNYAYTTAGGLVVIDVSDPRNPRTSGRLDLEGGVSSIQLLGQYAYLGSSRVGLHVIDISNPSSPVLAGSLLPVAGIFTHQVQVAENRAYLAALEGGVQVVDVLNPSRPLRLGGFSTPGSTFGLQAKGNRLYVISLDPGSRSWRLRILGIGQPQTIDLSAIPRRAIAGTAMNLNARSSSGLPVTFRRLSGPALLAGDILTVTGVGTVRVQAEQPGDELYAPAFVDFTIDALAEDPTKAWLRSHHPELALGQDEATADPDGDGAVNALECLLGTDPTVSRAGDGRLQSGICVEEQGQRFYSLKFTIDVGLEGQLAWTVEQSGTLSPDSWEPVPSVQVRKSAGELTVKIPMAGAEQRMFRLKVHVP